MTETKENYFLNLENFSETARRDNLKIWDAPGTSLTKCCWAIEFQGFVDQPYAKRAEIALGALL